jgi:UDP-GlcNAc3NAcA epimerase
LVHTGQHFDANMSEVFFRELKIPEPRYHLGIGGGTHGQNTGRMVEAIESVLLTERPDAVLVYGDTDSTLAAAIATCKLSMPLAHVEAGLRSFRRSMPEERNRVVADHLADILYAPTAVAVANLHREGVSHAAIAQVGDVMFDIVRNFTSIAETTSTIMREMALEPREFALMTVHRQVNADDRGALAAILDGIADAPFPIVFPVHPRTRARLATLGVAVPPIVRVIDPLGYYDTLALERNARLILTDSGGMQKEAYFHGVPCLTLRDETEWTELVDSGANVLVGANADRIRDALSASRTFTAPDGLYGDGFAARKIVLDLLARIG